MNLFDLPVEPDEPDEAETVDRAQFNTLFAGVPAPVAASVMHAMAVREDQAMISASPAVEVMPPDFKLPDLIKFVPDARLKQVADALAVKALTYDLATPEGFKGGDACVVSLRGAIAAIEANFSEPTKAANSAHKWLTSTKGAWIKQPTEAAAKVAAGIVAEQLRQSEAATKAARDAQALADQQARDRAAEAAKAAEKAQAPPQVVAALKQQATTAVAPPVAAAPVAASRSTGSTSGWKARLAGSPAELDPHPLVKDLTDAQRLQLVQVLKAIIAGALPITTVKELNWQYLDDRAKGEQRSFAIPGLEAFESVAPRAKPGRKA